MEYTAFDYEQSAKTFQEAGDIQLAECALKRAAELRAEGDTSRWPTPCTLSEIAAAVIHFEQIGNHKVAAQGRALVTEMVLIKSIRRRR